jgi:hypothetical protein
VKTPFFFGVLLPFPVIILSHAQRKICQNAAYRSQKHEKIQKKKEEPRSSFVYLLIKEAFS